MWLEFFERDNVLVTFCSTATTGKERRIRLIWRRRWFSFFTKKSTSFWCVSHLLIFSLVFIQVLPGRFACLVRHLGLFLSHWPGLVFKSHLKVTHHKSLSLSQEGRGWRKITLKQKTREPFSHNHTNVKNDFHPRNVPLIKSTITVHYAAARSVLLHTSRCFTPLSTAILRHTAVETWSWKKTHLIV